ncbi:VPLPA-CTERM sorting domain-containing protein [Celeribacter neptunius]|uniref:VPLPA-CTERM protein sorting domain-containing protein n=1 Tax=Celeribacter neptunius TaxID=588602 RepID=A0A1I3J5C7_9RHOB|nr:VPLPA-CTERM sorting domain-containing protein [Celeribacter neptunius]SFI55105.1 VPLPA-CTERM protein sorting domain-containing protein [Celeribacter neptunius]
MKINMLKAAFAALFLYSTPAFATIITGAVTTGSGSFVNLSGTSGFSVGQNNFDDLNLYAFDEQQNVVLTEDVSVNIGSGISAGSYISSHYLAFDPLNTAHQVGWVQFDSAIYGVATTSALVSASAFLGAPGVTYLSPSLLGLEGGDSVWVDSNDNTKLWVDWTASNPGDYVRVFTDYSPAAAVPLPASAPLLLAALGLFAGVKRRRKIS